MTGYSVLVYEGDGKWSEVAHLSSYSADAAVKEAMRTNSLTAGRFVAIPTRSWKPVTFRAEQQLSFVKE